VVVERQLYSSLIPRNLHASNATTPEQPVKEGCREATALCSAPAAMSRELVDERDTEAALRKGDGTQPLCGQSKTTGHEHGRPLEPHQPPTPVTCL
jgi:hypothetical protein